MQSHLTRYVFRRILTSRSIPHNYCALESLRRQQPCRQSSCTLPHTSRRAFTSIFRTEREPERVVKKPNLAPGLSEMFYLSKMLRNGTRPPPTTQLKAALREYFNSKWTVNKIQVKVYFPCRDFELEHVIRTIQYLKATEPSIELPQEELRSYLTILAAAPTSGNSLPKIAKLLYEWTGKQRDDSVAYIKALASHGFAEQAHTELESIPESHRADQALQWLVLEGYAKEGNISELRNISMKISTEAKLMLAYYCAKAGDFEFAMEWLSASRQLEATETERKSILFYWNKAVDALIKLSWQSGKPHLAENLVLETLEAGIVWRAQINDERAYIRPVSAVIVWGAATGKSVSELEQMIQAVLDRAPEGFRKWSETLVYRTVINDLLEYAIFKRAPYLAERYLAIGHRHRFLPNARTYILQMTYRLDGGDLDGAKTAFQMLQAEEIQGTEDEPIVNRYIRELISSPSTNPDDIMSACETLASRGALFEPSTVSLLTTHHLARDELYDTIDLLQTNVPRFSFADRALVRDAMVAFCLSRETSTAQAWDTYMILREVFDETPRELRIRLMINFAERRHPDLAVHVFSHMRTHTDTAVRADVETYIAAFCGIAATADAESLEHVHNQMKLDDTIDPSTRLYNALMLAYAAVNDPGQAFEFWTEIEDSREGPSLQSIVIAMRVCEGHPMGYVAARRIWAKLRRWDIEIDRAVMAAYVGALASGGLKEEVFEVLDKCEPDFGIPVDKYLLGTLLNTSRMYAQQAKVVAWIEKNHPIFWQEMQSDIHTEPFGPGMLGYGIESDDLNKPGELERLGMDPKKGLKVYKMDRTLEP